MGGREGEGEGGKGTFCRLACIWPRMRRRKGEGGGEEEGARSRLALCIA